jgi:hypothetical protein
VNNAFLITSIVILLVLLISPNLVSAETWWYPGKGLKQGDYFIYNVCSIDWNNCSPLEINFWIKNETKDESGFNVVFVVVDGSLVQKGNMIIGKITPDPIYSDPNISHYAEVYKNTVLWLDSFATRDSPKSFDYHSWSRNDTVGNNSPGPVGQDEITVGAAGTFNAQVIGWYNKGNATNKIWIDPNLPFPVEAIVYTYQATGSSPPFDYTLELLKTGNSQTESDFLQVIPLIIYLLL